MRCASYVKEAEAPFTVAEQNGRIASMMVDGWQRGKQYADAKNGMDAFMNIIRDGVGRQFDCVLMDSIFLFGESLWQAEEVLSNTFFDAGIQFGVAEDHFISAGLSKQKVSDYFAEKREQSEEGHSLLPVNEAKLAPRDCRYGYRLTEDRMGLVVDEATAKAVKEIFSLCLEGMKVPDIASLMQKRGYMNPMDYKKLEIHHTVPPFPTSWNTDSIRNILRTELYTGTGTKNSRGQAILIHANPLISREDFEEAQKRIAKKKIPLGFDTNAFFRRIYAEGKAVLTREENGELYFLLDGSEIPYSSVEKEVREAVKTEIHHVKTAIEKLKHGCEDELQADIEPLRKRAWALFTAMGEAEDDALEELDAEFTVLTARETELRKVYSAQNPWIEKYREMTVPRKIDFSFVRQWIKRVELGDGVRVTFHKQEWKDQLPKTWFEGD